MPELKIIPILGRKVNVQADDPTMFQFVGENIALTHDAGGVNFDLSRDGIKNTCTKSYGSVLWSNTANADATKCLGLFELFDGTNRDHIYIDNGSVYVFDAALDPAEVEDSGSTTFAQDSVDLYSMIQIGDYFVFADRGEHTPFKWKNGDANLTELIQSGTEYKFRYLEVFQRRVIGMYSGQTDGDIEIRWSTAWPATAIAALNFPAASQLYIPNDDKITGGRTMGHDRMYIYSENSITQMIYYPDFAAPFSLFTVVPQQGSVNHHGIISLGDRHLLFNRNYGFCEYRGGTQFPFGGRPISDNIESDIQNFNADYFDLIVGTFIPFQREAVWTVPTGGEIIPDKLYFFNIDTGQWRIEDKSARYVDNWRMYDDFTWNDLITSLGGAGAVWTGASVNTWAFYTATRQRLVYGNTAGKLHYRGGESLAGSNLDGYRIEPIVHFGNRHQFKFLREIWFEMGNTGNYSIDVSWRGGDTVGELIGQAWTSLPSLSVNSPSRAVVNVARNARLHQIKWGTDKKDEKFQVNAITFVYEPGATV